VTSSLATSASTASTVASRGRPPKPQNYQTAAATSNNVDKKSNVENSSRLQRRSKSEYRQRKSPSRVQPTSKFYDIDIDVKRQKAERDLSSWSSSATTTTATTATATYHNEVNGNHGYSELKENIPLKKVSKSQVDEKKSRGWSKSRTRYGQMANNGLLTVWPGKEGVWLPQ
jgi:hypothetical protein